MDFHRNQKPMRTAKGTEPTGIRTSRSPTGMSSCPDEMEPQGEERHPSRPEPVLGLSLRAAGKRLLGELFVPSTLNRAPLEEQESDSQTQLPIVRSSGCNNI